MMNENFHEVFLKLIMMKISRKSFIPMKSCYPILILLKMKRTFNENLKSFSVECAIKYSLDSEPVKSLPKSVIETSIFAVDLNVFNLKDLLADVNSAYQEYGDKGNYHRFTNSFDIMFCSNQSVIIDKNMCLFQKRFYKSKAD